MHGNIHGEDKLKRTEKFLIYCMNYQPTFNFKSSRLSLEIEENMKTDKNQFLSNVNLG